MSATEPDRLPEFHTGMGSVFLQGPTPPISLVMAIDPPVWHLSTGLDERPRLNFTITSHFNHPVTLRTAGTALASRRQYEGSFRHQPLIFSDVETGQQIYCSGSQPQRYPAGRRLGTSDERDFITLQPGTPVTISYGLPCCVNIRDRDGRRVESAFTPWRGPSAGVPLRREFEIGRRYRVGIQTNFQRCAYKPSSEGEEFQEGFWWRYGTKEQVMAPAGTLRGLLSIGWSENQIRISGVPDVEFEVQE